MTTFLVLDDHLSTAGLLVAGQVVSDSDYDITRLTSAGASLTTYNVAMAPFVDGWRAQADLNPTRPSLGVLLLAEGFFFGTGSGDVVGPAGAIPDTIALYDGVTGKMIKGSVVGISAGGNITTPGTVDGRDVSADGAALDAVVIQSSATTAELAAHEADTANPHATTAAQVGAVPVAGHAATSVVGRSAGSVGDAADIAAGVDDRLLARTGGVLGFVQLALGMIPDALITLAKMAASAADQAAATASLRTLGTTSVQACAGDDARLSDSRAPNGAASGQLGGTYPGPDVRGLRETAGPTNLTIGAIADGQMVQRVGATLQGSTISVLGLHSPETVIAAGPNNITTAADVAFASITPAAGAGTYMVLLNGSVEYPVNQNVTASIWLAGAQVIGTERQVSGDQGSLAVAGVGSFAAVAFVTVAAAQAIEGRARRSGGTAVLNGRTLSVIKVG